jgi:hypothetical protein
MDLQEIHLLATCKTTAAFGAKYAADFPPDSLGGKQFALAAAAVPQAGALGAQQISGGEQKKAGVKSKAVAYHQLHDDLLAMADAAHSLVLLGMAGLDGKFHLPRNHGAQDVLNAARAFKTDAAAFSAPMISVGLDAGFLTHLDTHISDYENAITAKGAGQSTAGGATGGIEDTTHRAAIALHVLNTIVRNKYKNDPAKLAEWTIASHVEKHTPVPREKKPSDTPPAK